ncbi:hypothetical protein D0T50_02065 [Bacteroides sp. 214]|nr:hypothetical protein [Bacteroides sp. 214]
MLLDWVLMGIAFLLLIVFWGVALLHLQEFNTSDNISMGIGVTVVTILLLGSSFISARWFNFPVRITEQNIRIQYLLATRLMRIVAIFINMTFLSLLLKNLEILKGAAATVVTDVVMVLLFVPLLIYFVLAFMRRGG